jgi:mRNA-degrading endonuclease HigB of HigAB toxin-antitoxin module
MVTKKNNKKNKSYSSVAIYILWLLDTTENCSLDTRTYTQPLLDIKQNLQFIDKFLRDEKSVFVMDGRNYNLLIFIIFLLLFRSSSQYLPVTAV